MVLEPEVVVHSVQSRLVEVVAPGPVGPVGPVGTIDSAGLISDARLSHHQATAASIWTITHNLGKNPSVSIVDSAGDECEGEVRHISVNELVVSFSAAFTGRAFLN